MPVALGGASLAAIAALALSLTVRSLAWPVINDAVVMHYIAARLLEGAVPYRDLFDMNFPGVYLVHMLGLVLFGPSDAGFRALDLIMLVGTVAGLGVALTSFGRWAAAFGVALFWLYHLAAGPYWGAGQRDFFQCLPLAWMTAAAFAYMKSGRVVTLALAGVSLGAAVCVKPFALLMAPVLMVLAWRRPSAERVTALAVLAVGFAVPAAVVLTWLASTGGLAAFLDIVGGYLPLYGGFGRQPLSKLLFVPRRALTIWALSGFLGLWRAGRLDRRMLVLGSGFVYGWLNIILQGKGTGYHAYPLALFAIAAVAAGAGVALEKGKRVLSAMLQVVLLVTVARVAVPALKAPNASSMAKVMTRVHAVAATLAPVVSKGESVQVLEGSDGLIHALYLLRARQPTRFIYDYHFYHAVDHPYIQRLRAELLEGLRARPPGAVVLIEPDNLFRSTPGGYGRLEGFPALSAFLKSSYRLAYEGEAYRIYVPRANR
jgi:hypothetical protein